jgi:hypothetical protein
MTDPAPAAPSTSLSPELAAAKSSIEAGIGNPDSPYWKDSADGTTTARGVQARYADIIRAELAGGADYVGPSAGIDFDLPISAAHYDISSAPGARSMTSEDRAIVDKFMPAAHAAGLGQRKFAECVGWCLTHSGPITEELAQAFVRFAVERGYSDQAIEFCLDFAGRLEDGDVTAAAPRGPGGEFVGKAAVADERAEIEKIMGDPGSEYWRGPKAATMQARYRELLAAA